MTPAGVPREAEPPATEEPDVERVVRLLRAAPEVIAGRRTLALDGRSGAGKTELAHRIAALLRADGTATTVVGLDELYPGWDGLERGVDLLVAHVLAPFAAGQRRLHLPRWDWTADRPGPVEDRDAGGVLVVDGVGCGARRCAPYLSLLVWVEAPDSVRRERALARDGETYAPHWDLWARHEQAHQGRERTSERAGATVVVR